MARTAAPGTRDRILDVAADLFYRQGIRAVGMAQIVAEANTGKNLLYQHFQSKDDLVAAYLLRARTQRTAATERAVQAAGDDPRAKLLAIVEDTARLVRRKEFRGCAFRNYLAEFPAETNARAVADESTPSGVAIGYLRSIRSQIDHLAGDVCVDADGADALAEGLWLVIDGLYLQAVYRDRVDPDLERGVANAVALARVLLADCR